MFAGRILILATHQKEQVLGPWFGEVLGVRIVVPEDLDTDLLGTFSREKDRENDPLTKAKKKCEWAMELSGADLALSSETNYPAWNLNLGSNWKILRSKSNSQAMD